MKTKVKKEESEKKITREEALKKLGKYAAFTAAASILLLTPKASQAQSLPTQRGRDY